MNAIKEAMQNCKNAIMSRKSSIDKFAKTVGTPGTRAGPTKTSKDDAKNGVRFDYGETFKASNGKAYQNINLQLNKGAENPTLARLERENKHKIWAQAAIEKGLETDAEKEQVMEDYFQALGEDFERRSEAGSDSEGDRGKAKKGKGKATDKRK